MTHKLNNNYCDSLIKEKLIESIGKINLHLVCNELGIDNIED